MTTSATEARQKLAGNTIWLWHYLHADWQWEQSRAWHEDRYVFSVGEALDIMRQNPEIKYYFDSASEFFEPIERKLAPRLDEIRQHVRDGRIHIASAQVANCRPTQVADETYLRNLQIGRAYFEKLLPPTDLSLFHSVDIAIGGTQMPQILQLAGFKFYKAWRPHGPMNAHKVPHQFFWEGLDGSKIMVLRGPYGGLYYKSHVPDNYAEDWDGAVGQMFDHMFRDQLLLNRSPSQQLWMIQGNDDARLFRIWNGDAPIDLPGFIETWRQREATPIRWCTPLDYAYAVAEHGDQLATWKGVLDGCDVGYNMAPNGAYGLWTWRQMNDRRLIRAEWWTAAAADTGYNVPMENWQRLWRQHLTYQAHAQEDSFAEDYDYLVDLGQQVRIESEKLQHDALVAIAQAAGGGDLCTQFVFNPHPWPVEADVPIYHACAAAGVESLAVVDGEGNPLPSQLLRELRHPRYAGTVNDQRLLTRIRLPAMGYRRIQIVEQQESAPTSLAAPEGNVLETSALKLVFRDHLLREVHDKASGAIYFARDGAGWPRLFYHVLDNANWLQGGPELRREAFVPRKSQWLHSGPLRWVHRSEGQLGPYQAQLDIIVADQGREIQVQVKLEGHWSEPPASGYATISGDIEAGGQITVDVPFGVEGRDPDHEPYVNNPPQGEDLGELGMFERLRPGIFWGRSWADWSGNERGLTLISADGAYFWLKEPGLLGHVLLRACVRTPGTWEEFCPEVMTGSGVHRFQYAFRFHDGEWRAADPQHRAAELRHPVVVARPNHVTEASLPANEHSFLALEGPAMLSAYYRQGGSTVLRMVENEGQGGIVSVKLDWTPVSVEAIDLTGKTITVPIQQQGQTLNVTIKPWQIITLQMERTA
ncbi:MAG: hypothetical protein U0175_38050 [Caldilineaceae bacterium]